MFTAILRLAAGGIMYLIYYGVLYSLVNSSSQMDALNLDLSMHGSLYEYLGLALCIGVSLISPLLACFSYVFPGILVSIVAVGFIPSGWTIIILPTASAIIYFGAVREYEKRKNKSVAKNNKAA